MGAQLAASPRGRHVGTVPKAATDHMGTPTTPEQRPVFPAPLGTEAEQEGTGRGREAVAHTRAQRQPWKGTLCPA